jgi:hypothetical protein
MESRCRIELPDAMAHAIFWPILLLGLVLDLWTKRAVFAWLPLGSGAEILDGFLAFRTALNSGAAFGIASGQQPFLIVSRRSAVIFGVLLRQAAADRPGGGRALRPASRQPGTGFSGGQVRDFIEWCTGPAGIGIHSTWLIRCYVSRSHCS